MAKHGKHEKYTPKATGKKFGKTILIYSLCCFLIVAGILTWLWLRMASFQKNYDAEMRLEEQKHAELLAQERARLQAEEEQAAREARERDEYRAPQRAFEAWLAEATTDYWTDLWIIYHPDVPETRDRIYNELQSRFSGVTAYKAERFTQEAPVYALYREDDLLAEVSLSGSGTDWTVADVAFCFSPEQSASIVAPDNATVFCNGIPLDRSSTGDAVSYFSCEDPSGEGLKGRLKNPITWRTYTVRGLLTEPELTYTVPDGLTVREDTDGTMLMMADMADYTKYCDNSVAMVKAYMYYFMKGKTDSGTNLYKVLDYYQDGSALYKSVYSSYYIVSYNITYENIDVSKTEAENVIVWADNCFSIDVAYDADCTYYGTHVDYATDVMRVFYLDSSSGYVLTAIENRYSE